MKKTIPQRGLGRKNESCTADGGHYQPRASRLLLTSSFQSIYGSTFRRSWLSKILTVRQKEDRDLWIHILYARFDTYVFNSPWEIRFIYFLFLLSSSCFCFFLILTTECFFWTDQITYFSLEGNSWNIRINFSHRNVFLRFELPKWIYLILNSFQI